MSNIKKIVQSVEIILSRYDANVQSAIDSKRFEYIESVSKASV
ncbi:MAG: hypothetical protein RL662_21, partial [Bacteroidota bacterium]